MGPSQEYTSTESCIEVPSTFLTSLFPIQNCETTQPAIQISQLTIEESTRPDWSARLIEIHSANSDKPQPCGFLTTPDLAQPDGKKVQRPTSDRQIDSNIHPNVQVHVALERFLNRSWEKKMATKALYVFDGETIVLQMLTVI